MCIIIYLVLTFFNRVTDLQPKDTPEEPYFYTFRVQCTSCREVHPNWVNVSRFVSMPFAMRRTLLMPMKESNEMSGSRGEANFVWRCKSCKVRWFLRISWGLSSCVDYTFRENRQPLSRPHLPSTSMLPLRRGRISSSLTAGALSLLSSRRM